MTHTPIVVTEGNVFVPLFVAMEIKIQFDEVKHALDRKGTEILGIA